MASLATLAEFAQRIPGGVPVADEPRAQAALDDASALIRTEANKGWDTPEDPAPEVAKTICIAAAKRAFLNPDLLKSVSLDNYTRVLDSSSPDVYLTAAERRLIRKVAGGSGVWALATTRSEDNVQDVPSVLPDTTGAPIEETDPFGAGWS